MEMVRLRIHTLVSIGRDSVRIERACERGPALE